MIKRDSQTLGFSDSPTAVAVVASRRTCLRACVISASTASEERRAWVPGALRTVDRESTASRYDDAIFFLATTTVKNAICDWYTPRFRVPTAWFDRVAPCVPVRKMKGRLPLHIFEGKSHSGFYLGPAAAPRRRQACPLGLGLHSPEGSSNCIALSVATPHIGSGRHGVRARCLLSVQHSQRSL